MRENHNKFKMFQIFTLFVLFHIFICIHASIYTSTALNSPVSKSKDLKFPSFLFRIKGGSILVPKDTVSFNDIIQSTDKLVVLDFTGIIVILRS